MSMSNSIVAPSFGVAPTGINDKNNEDLKMSDIFDDFMFGAEGMSFDMLGDSDEDLDDDDGMTAAGSKRKRKKPSAASTTTGLPLTKEEIIEKRERNREHAKRSRIRKKFLLESLQHSVNAIKSENDKLKAAIRKHVGYEAEALIAEVEGTKTATPDFITTTSGETAKRLEDPDYGLIKTLQSALQSFVICDPSQPDNPIVYASQGFIALTGYKMEDVLGRNCRFLQGPQTDDAAIMRIRNGVHKGIECTTVLLNYCADGSTFWNQFFVSALKDNRGNIVNYLGVQCKVSEDYAHAYLANQDKIKG